MADQTGGFTSDVVVGPATEAEVTPQGDSLRRSSVARFLADSSGLVFGVLGGVITARWLGPSGKGLFSSLTFLAALVMQAGSLGLGDAAIVMVGQRRASIQEAVSITVALTLCSAAVGTALFWAAAVLWFRDDLDALRTAILVATLGFPVSLFAYVLSFMLSARQMLVANSLVLGTISAGTALGLVLFVAVVPLEIAGGTLAGVFGAGAGLAVGFVLLTRAGLSLRPRWNREYVGAALRYGISVEASYLVTVMFLRVDLLFAYALAGPAAAGQYSVALTISALVALLPIAMSHASFPRLANVGEDEANELTGQVCRYGVAAATVAAALLGLATPVAIPLLFGREFAPAVAPTLILLVGGILWATQWILCRAAAARGRPGLLLRSFGLGLVVMAGLDYVLIPRIGIVGAALSAVAGPAAGLVLALRSYHRSSWWERPLTVFVPRWKDFRAFFGECLGMLPISRGQTAKRGGQP
ncbi:MAG: polysaccharide biosynthesis C-terminal domain-containing protein [Actinomycetota bacterium]|nr:polysaccharide biosynthesis C-terminal domain-containing protein [Actinomycetota bacterium]